MNPFVSATAYVSCGTFLNFKDLAHPAKEKPHTQRIARGVSRVTIACVPRNSTLLLSYLITLSMEGNLLEQLSARTDEFRHSLSRSTELQRVR